MARFVLPQLLARLARGLKSEGADELARAIVADVHSHLSNEDLHALAQVLPALGHECRNQLAVRGDVG